MTSTGDGLDDDCDSATENDVDDNDNSATGDDLDDDGGLGERQRLRPK